LTVRSRKNTSHRSLTFLLLMYVLAFSLMNVSGVRLYMLMMFPSAVS